LLGKSEGEIPGRSHKNVTRANPYKVMTPPSPQNLKALGLWVFFLICCSTISFLLNVELRLTLGYLQSPLQLRVPSTLVHSPSNTSTSQTPHLYRRSHTYTRHACLKSPLGQGSNCSRPSRKSSALIPLVGKIRGGNTEKILNNKN